MKAQQEIAKEERAFDRQKELLKLQQEYKDADIQTSVIKDEATGKQQLINSKTGEVLKTFETGLKAEAAKDFNPNIQKISDTEYGYFDASGKLVRIGADTPVSTESINDFTTTRNGSTNIQCGELVNDYWKKVTGSSA